jgi:hypothetical protein
MGMRVMVMGVVRRMVRMKGRVRVIAVFPVVYAYIINTRVLC